MQLPALDDRDTRGVLWGEAVGRFGGTRPQNAPFFLLFSFRNTVLFYEHYDVYCRYSDELIFPRRIVQINRLFIRLLYQSRVQ